jgi:hypothetical protein
MDLPGIGDYVLVVATYPEQAAVAASDAYGSATPLNSPLIGGFLALQQPWHSR